MSELTGQHRRRLHLDNTTSGNAEVTAQKGGAVTPLARSSTRGTGQTGSYEPEARPSASLAELHDRIRHPARPPRPAAGLPGGRR